MKRAHVIGAGLAGLSAALRLSEAGVAVTLHEAAPHAGGRCRSYFDPKMGTQLDNGAHLMLSGNVEVTAYLKAIGSEDQMDAAPTARFDFFDAKSTKRWALDLGAGRGLFSVMCALMRAHNRPPGVSIWGLLKDLNALKSGAKKTVGECVGTSSAFTTFWEPLCVAVLNAPPSEAAAVLLWRVLADTALKGGVLARPIIARDGLGAALVAPALAQLKKLGAEIHLGQRVHGIEIKDDRVVSLNLGGSVDVLGAGDQVVLAVPHFVVHDLLEGIAAPKDSRAILNVHFQVPENPEVPYPGMTGMIHSDAQWVFVRGLIASVTVSAADAWMDKDAKEIADTLWPDVAKSLWLSGDVPINRVIKERRATFAQTLDGLALRPKSRTEMDNVFLAGDWTATDLPATIEGALKSGRLAAEAALAT